MNKGDILTASVILVFGLAMSIVMANGYSRKREVTHGE